MNNRHSLFNPNANFTISPSNTLPRSSFLNLAKQTGITIAQDGNATVWEGMYSGNIKPKGPLAGKKIGVIVASEFSDFQAYYLVSYLGEFGGLCDFLLVDWVYWKNIRPTNKYKGVHGMWALSLDPISIFSGNKYTYKSLLQADPKSYDAIIVLGCHSADVMVTEFQVIDFIKIANANGAVMGSIGEGSIPYIRAGIVNNKKVTGNEIVDYMLKKIAKFIPDRVVVDGKLITAKNTVDTARFVRALCKAFEPKFSDDRKNILKNKRILMIAGEDYEDIEIIVPVMELLYRGAKLCIAIFKPPLRSRPAMLGLDIAQGNYGTSVPLQDIPENYYTIININNAKLSEFDAVFIPGSFCPWNIIASNNTNILKEAYTAGKIIAAICHAPISLAAADLVKNKKLTGCLACIDSVEIMGGIFNPSDWAASIDGQIVTGRTPPEIPEFLDAFTEALLRQ